MGKSFVLKDTEGRAKGYIQQTQDAIRCRVRVSDAQLFVCFESGKAQCKAIDQADEEFQWYAHGEVICGACIIVQEAIAADTGAQSRRDYAEYRAKESAPVISTVCDRKRENTVLQEARMLPQRRWPPHPSIPEAAYECGAWLIE